MKFLSFQSLQLALRGATGQEQRGAILRRGRSPGAHGHHLQGPRGLHPALLQQRHRRL